MDHTDNSEMINLRGRVDESRVLASVWLAQADRLVRQRADDRWRVAWSLSPNTHGYVLVRDVVDGGTEVLGSDYTALRLLPATN